MKKLLGGIFLALFFVANTFANFGEDINNIANESEKQEYINNLESQLEQNNKKVSSNYKIMLPGFPNQIEKSFNTKEKLTNFIKRLEMFENKIKSSFRFVVTNLKINSQIIYLNTYLELENNSDEQEEDINEDEEIISEELPFINHNFKILIYKKSPNSELFKHIAIGSGILVGKNQIVTNAHVINEEKYEEDNPEPKYYPQSYIALCETTNSFKIPECKYTGKVIASDSDRDIALVQINDKDIFGKTVNLEGNLKLKEEETNFGDSVKILGFPSIGEDTVTYTEGKISGFSEGKYKTDATIDKGNSGGGAFNQNNEIVGISQGARTNNNTIGYLVPSFEILDFLDNIDEFKVKEEKIKLSLFNDVLTYSYKINHGEKDYNRRGVEIKGLFDKLDKNTPIYTNMGLNYDNFIFTKNKLKYIINISDIIDNTNYFEVDEYNFDYRNDNAYDIVTGDENTDYRETKCDEEKNGYKICRIKYYIKHKNPDTGNYIKKLDTILLTGRKLSYNTNLYIEVDITNYKTKEDTARNNIKRIMENATFSFQNTDRTVSFDKLILPKEESKPFLRVYTLTNFGEILELKGLKNSGKSYITAKISELPKEFMDEIEITTTNKAKKELTRREKLKAIKKYLEEDKYYTEVKESAFLNGGKYIMAKSADNRKLTYITVDEDNKCYFIDFDFGERNTTKFLEDAYDLMHNTKVIQGEMVDKEEEDNNEDN